MNDSRHDELAGHLRSLWGRAIGLTLAERLPKAILADPQAHVVALVAAGVLREVLTPAGWAYQVVPPKPPHVHEWRVMVQSVPGSDWDADPGEIHVGCACGANATALNRLPIEVPNA